ncbi:periplasmic flagellar collar protein FlcA [Spirochaeta cellobiosiphila]|uniref:periplasmic flagellar collar protein FlcA n=1 Tax=Spirochaeta cellobiosiphila TaxID=504483 RepID=UPI0004171E41|nr:hypothetical protein [Spirochaeta cellobiosiphila]
MPSLDAIEDIKRQIQSFANEPTIRQERGEDLEDIQPPVSDISEDLNSLLEETREELDQEPEPAPEEEYSDLDIDSFFDDDLDLPEDGNLSVPDDLFGDDLLSDEPFSDDAFSDSVENQDEDFSDFDLDEVGEIPEIEDSLEEQTDDLDVLENFDDVPDLESSTEDQEDSFGIDNNVEFESKDVTQNDSLDDDLDPSVDTAALAAFDSDMDFSIDDDLAELSANINDPSNDEESSVEEEPPVDGLDITSEPDSPRDLDIDLDDSIDIEEESFDELEDIPEMETSGDLDLDLPDFGEDMGDPGFSDEDFEFSFDEDLSDKPSDSTPDELEEFSLDDPIKEQASTDDDMVFPDFSNDMELDSSSDDEFSIETNISDDFPELASFDSDDDFESNEDDEFDLGDFGSEFGLNEEDDLLSDPGSLNPAMDMSLDKGEQPGEFEISEEEFKKLQRKLGTLPLNLRIAIEEAIGEKDLSTEDNQRIINMLIKDASPKALAKTVGDILGKVIRIPSGFKESGLELDRKRSTLLYNAVHIMLPIIRNAFLLSILTGVLIILGYQFAYRPLKAKNLYTRGYESVLDDDYELGKEDFRLAWNTWKDKSWFYKYAEAYLSRRQYDYAAEKYSQLIQNYPKETNGYLEWAKMASNDRNDYAEAERILKMGLDINRNDYDLKLYLGDNYLEWAYEDPSYFESARRSYAELRQEAGGKNEIWMRMLRLFIRTDNIKEVNRIKDMYLDVPARNLASFGDTWAELGGYLIDRDEISDVESILLKSYEINPSYPETHYELARYFDQIGKEGDEKKALTSALYFFEQSMPLSQRRLPKLVDTHKRIGKLQYDEGDYLSAEQSYGAALNIYEDSKSRGLMSARKEFGEIYKLMGDLNYYVSHDYQTALDYYVEGERNYYQEPEVNYRKGFVYYLQNKFKKSLDEFYDSLDSIENNENLRYAMANTLYRRKDYYAARGYYEGLKKDLEAKYQSIDMLLPEDNPDHEYLVEDLYKVYNNLGVSLVQVSRRMGDNSKKGEAQYYFTKASELIDNLSRDPDSGVREELANLPYVNSRLLLYPQSEADLEIYQDIPRDLQSDQF